MTATSLLDELAPVGEGQALGQAIGWSALSARLSTSLNKLDTFEVAVKITRVAGLVIEAAGLHMPIGSLCYIPLEDDKMLEAEVVGFENGNLLLMPYGGTEGVGPASKILSRKFTNNSGLPPPGQLPVGACLLGRVLDASAQPLDGKGPLNATEFASMHAQPINPLNRTPIDTILDVGVRAINGLLTVGRGQRMGVFAGSGVGKSVLLGMMARYTDAEIIVVGLIGERGREVKEFIEEIIGPETLLKTAVIAAPADAPALMRLQGARYACTLSLIHI